MTGNERERSQAPRIGIEQPNHRQTTGAPLPQHGDEARPVCSPHGHEDSVRKAATQPEDYILSTATEYTRAGAELSMLHTFSALHPYRKCAEGHPSIISIFGLSKDRHEISPSEL